MSGDARASARGMFVSEEVNARARRVPNQIVRVAVVGGSRYVASGWSRACLGPARSCRGFQREARARRTDAKSRREPDTRTYRREYAGGDPCPSCGLAPPARSRAEQSRDARFETSRVTRRDSVRDVLAGGGPAGGW